MARFPTIDMATVSLSTPNYLALERAIAELETAERQFYRSRREELNGYPGQSSRTTPQTERAYDALLGPTPWTYSSQLSRSGNSLRSSSGQPAFYVQLPSVLNQAVNSDFEDSDSNEYVLYYPGEGLRRIDLLFTDISFFDLGSSGNADDGNDDDPTSITYRTGFGEIPVAYESNSRLSGRVAQTLFVAGSEWDRMVRDAYDNYIDELDKYEDTSGGGNFDFFTGGSPDRHWDGYRPEPNSFGYNRPSSLSIKIVEESRGYS